MGKLAYSPHLDGLRALGALAVLFFHTHLFGFAGGYLGVDVFFVLSGYLITAILVRQRYDGGIDIAKFYTGRFRRLYPALAFMLLVYLVVASALAPSLDHWKAALASAAYVMDYGWTYPQHNSAARYVFHTWSLAAEMHFYLVWPLVILAALNRHSADWLRKMLFWIAVGGTAWALLNQLLGINAYYRMDTRIGQMAAGGWLALVQITRPSWYSGNYSRAWGWAGLAILAALVMRGLPMPWKVLTVAPVVTAATLAVIETSSRLPLSSPPLVWLGRMSYGIYLWHFPLAIALGDEKVPHLTAIVLPASIALAALSYYTVEAWFRLRRPRYRGVVNAMEGGPR